MCLSDITFFGFEINFHLPRLCFQLPCSQAHGLHQVLTHWGRVTHICVSRLTITGSDNGLSSGQRQAIIWTNFGILLIGPLGTNFSENSIEMLTFSFTKMRLKVSSAKWLPFCLGLNVLSYHPYVETDLGGKYWEVPQFYWTLMTGQLLSLEFDIEL